MPSRLPARVYWFRRVLVLGTALGLVFGFAHLLDSDDSARSTSTGTTVAGTPTTAPEATSRPTAKVTAKAKAKATAKATPTVVPPAEPDGPCAPDEVSVAPVAGTAPAGRTVPLVLALSTTRAACTFKVSATSVVVKVSSAKGKVWSTQECPSAVPDAPVVVRSAAPTTIQVAWSGRGSDSTCSRVAGWAMPGTYQVVAAALGAGPRTASVTLTVPERPVVVRTIPPKTPKAPKQPKTPRAGT